MKLPLLKRSFLCPRVWGGDHLYYFQRVIIFRQRNAVQYFPCSIGIVRRTAFSHSLIKTILLISARLSAQAGLQLFSCLIFPSIIPESTEGGIDAVFCACLGLGK